MTRPVVFRNGNVFDGRRHRRGLAVVVSAGRISAVVPEADLEPPTGAEEVDLAIGLRFEDQQPAAGLVDVTFIQRVAGADGNVHEPARIEHHASQPRKLHGMAFSGAFLTRRSR